MNYYPIFNIKIDNNTIKYDEHGNLYATVSGGGTGDASIDDNHSSSTTTYSSNKIDQLLLDNQLTIEDNLNSTSSSHVLSAKQGNTLKTLIEDIEVPTKVSDLTNDLGFVTTDTTYSNATTSTAGLMSASDKSKLDGIQSSANNYTLPVATTEVLGGVKIDNNTIKINNGVISSNASQINDTTSSANSTYSSSKIDTLNSNKMNVENPTGTGNLNIGIQNTIAENISESAVIGYKNNIGGNYSFASGSENNANGIYSVAEGYKTTASGSKSHSEGEQTTASATGSHAEGFNTIANKEYQHVEGTYNIEDTTISHALIVGNGNIDSRSNAMTLDWDGNLWVQGRITSGSSNKSIPLIDDNSASTINTYSSSKIASLINSGSGISLVTDFGCVGDGETDDTDAFQSAIDSVQESGNLLYIPKGTYLITDRLIITEPINIQGTGIIESTIKFQGTASTETPYDETNYEYSNCAISIRANNVELSNFSIEGGDSSSTALTDIDGVIFHYPDETENIYRSAERCRLSNINIRYFRNGIFIYGGWNRVFERLEIRGCSENGTKYYPLEVSTVGHWSASGDVWLANQFVGNGDGNDSDDTAGMYCNSCKEITVWNSVFEYNDRAIITENCSGLVFKNCWNEANYNNILISGSVKFEGGYGIGKDTVEHILTSANDIVQFEGDTQNTIYKENALVFNQIGGIITKGVSIGLETENLLSNPNFIEMNNDSFYGWEKSASWLGTVIRDTPNYARIEVTDRTSDAYLQIKQRIEIGDMTSINASAYLKTDSRSDIDSYANMFVTWKNSSGDTLSYDNKTISFIGDDTWELHEYLLIPPSGAAYVDIGWGLGRNGTIYIKSPSVSDGNSAINSNVYIRKDADNDSQVIFSDINGDVIGELDFDNLGNSSNNSNVYISKDVDNDSQVIFSDINGGVIGELDFDNLGNSSSNSIPNYVTNEATRVCKQVINHSTGNCLTFMTLSDPHIDLGESDAVSSLVDAVEMMSNIKHEMFSDGIKQVLFRDAGFIFDDTASLFIPDVTDGTVGLTLGVVSKYLNWKYDDNVEPSDVTQEQVNECAKYFADNITINNNDSVTYNDNSKEMLLMAIDVIKGNNRDYVYSFNVEKNTDNFTNLKIFTELANKLKTLQADNYCFFRIYSGNNFVISAFSKNDFTHMCTYGYWKIPNPAVGGCSSYLYDFNNQFTFDNNLHCTRYYYDFNANEWTVLTSDERPNDYKPSALYYFSENVDGTVSNYAIGSGSSFSFVTAGYSEALRFYNARTDATVDSFLHSNYYYNSSVYENFYNSSGDYTTSISTTNNVMYEDVENYVNDYYNNNDNTPPSFNDIQRYINDQNNENRQPHSSTTLTFDSAKQAGQAAGLIVKSIGLDFVATLGDTTHGGTNTTLSNGIEEEMYWNQFIYEACCNKTTFKTVGNHDALLQSYTLENGKYLSDAQVYKLCGAYFTNDIVIDNEHPYGGYGYKDYPAQKVRVYCLNTSETKDDVFTGNDYGQHFTHTQMQWFINTLEDLISNDTNGEWKIITLSHHPVDYASSRICWLGEAIRLFNISAQGSLKQKSTDSNPISYDFSNNNGTQFVAAIHGHTHTYTSRDMYDYYNDNTYATTVPSVKVLATPNVCYGRDNTYYGSENYSHYASSITYQSGTGKDATAFIVWTFDLDNNILYGDHYGKGIDYEIDLSSETPPQESNSLINATTSINVPSGEYIFGENSQYVYSNTDLSAGSNINIKLDYDMDYSSTDGVSSIAWKIQGSGALSSSKYILNTSKSADAQHLTGSVDVTFTTDNDISSGGKLFKLYLSGNENTYSTVNNINLTNIEVTVINE